MPKPLPYAVGRLSWVLVCFSTLVSYHILPSPPPHLPLDHTGLLSIPLPEKTILTWGLCPCCLSSRNLCTQTCRWLALNVRISAPMPPLQGDLSRQANTTTPSQHIAQCHVKLPLNILCFPSFPKRSVALYVLFTTISPAPTSVVST